MGLSRSTWCIAAPKVLTWPHSIHGLRLLTLLYCYIGPSKCVLCFIILIQLTDCVSGTQNPPWWVLSGSYLFILTPHALIIKREGYLVWIVITLHIIHLVFQMPVVVLQSVQNRGLHSYHFEIVDMIYHSQYWSVVIDNRDWWSKRFTPLFFWFLYLHLWRWLFGLNWLLKDGIALVYLEAVLSESIISILPNAIAICCEIILSPNKVS